MNILHIYTHVYGKSLHLYHSTHFFSYSLSVILFAHKQSKLESYRDLEKTGKDLSADQKIAILKYDEVAMTLEFAREFSKQIEKIVITSEKDLKKKQKKDESLKKLNETSKIREVLIIQDILTQLKDESVRTDFLAGTNGAYKLEQSDLDLLDLL